MVALSSSTESGAPPAPAPPLPPPQFGGFPVAWPTGAFPSSFGTLPAPPTGDFPFTFLPPTTAAFPSTLSSTTYPGFPSTVTTSDAWPATVTATSAPPFPPYGFFPPTIGPSLAGLLPPFPSSAPHALPTVSAPTLTAATGATFPSFPPAPSGGPLPPFHPLPPSASPAPAPPAAIPPPVFPGFPPLSPYNPTPALLFPAVSFASNIPTYTSSNPCGPCAVTGPTPASAPLPPWNPCAVFPPMCIPSPPEIRYIPSPPEIKYVDLPAKPAPEDPKLRARVQELEAELAALRARQAEVRGLEEEMANLRAAQAKMEGLEEELAALRQAQLHIRALEEEIATLRLGQQRAQALEEEVTTLRTRLASQSESRSRTNITETYKVKTFEMAAKLAKMDGTDDGLYNGLPIEVEGEGLYIDLVRAGRTIRENVSLSGQTTSLKTSKETYKVKTFEMAEKLSKMDGTDDGLYNGLPIEIVGEGLYSELKRAGRVAHVETIPAVITHAHTETYKVNSFEMAEKLAKMDGTDDGLYNGLPIEVTGQGLYRDLVRARQTVESWPN